MGVTEKVRLGSRNMKVTGDIFYSAEELPVLQNRLYENIDEAVACPRGSVRLARDSETGVVTNISFQSKLVVYDEKYNNEQGLSEAFRNHLNIVAELIRSNFPEPDVIEVGCGKGRFISYLRERGFTVSGIDPTYEGDDPRVEKRFFDADCGISASGVVLRHVLEHVVDPFTFLRQIRDANGGSGLIYIEVPCFDWICENGAWFDIFYEHVNYFTASDFQRFFVDPPVVLKTFSGQYLSVFADLASLRNREALVIDRSCRVAPPSFADEILATVAYVKKRCEAHEGKVVVWGAASKGVISSLHLRRAGIEIDFIVDIDPAKQGKYLPASGLLVESPSRLIQETAPALVLVMNTNYFEEIKSLIPGRHECYAI